MTPLANIEMLLKICSKGEWEIRQTPNGAAVNIPGDRPSPAIADADARLMVLLKNNAEKFVEAVKAAQAVCEVDLYGAYETRLRKALEALGVRLPPSSIIQPGEDDGC